MYSGESILAATNTNGTFLARYSLQQYLFCSVLTATVFVLLSTHCNSICFAQYSLQQYLFCSVLTATVFVLLSTHCNSICFAQYSLQQYLFCSILTATRKLVFFLFNTRHNKYKWYFVLFNSHCNL